LVAANALPEPDFGLTDAWRGATGYCIVDAGDAPAPQFLATWRAWQRDPYRPRILHYVAFAPRLNDWAQSLGPAGQSADLELLERELDGACGALTTGIQRLRLERGAIQLTLCVGETRHMLRALGCEADALWLGSNAPERQAQWRDTDWLKALARHCRRGTRIRLQGKLATPEMLAGLRHTGFRFDEAHGAAIHSGVYDPPWDLRRKPLQRTAPTQALVVGAGLAGAAVAASLAQRGWQVQVIDAAAAPAQGASSLPVGLMVPHVSADDAPLSRASRAGLRATLHACRTMLREGQDWQPTEAVREGRCIEDAAWIKPAALVRAWLAQPGIRFVGGLRVAGVRRSNPDPVLGAHWQVLDDQARVLAQAPLLVICTAFDGVGMLARLPGAAAPLPCDEVAGQVAFGPWTSALASAAPGHPVSGHGHFIPDVAGDSGRFWLSGSTYERASLHALDARAGLEANGLRISGLLEPGAPRAAALIRDQFVEGQVGSWAGQRCTSRDRFPLAGACSADWPGLFLSTAMGSRGLSFAALCAELVAAQLHGEPIPLEMGLARAFSAQRFMKKAAQALF